MRIYPDPNQLNDNSGVKPPPPPPVTIRTMDLDVKSMEQSGGGKPVGETMNLTPSPIKKIEPPKPPEEGIKIKIPGYSGLEDKLFSPEILPASKPGEVPTKKPFSYVLAVVVIAAAVLIGALLYLFVYPLLVGTGVPQNNEQPGNATPPPPPPTPEANHVSSILPDKTEIAKSLQEATAETEVKAPILKEVILKTSGEKQMVLSEYLPKLIPELTATEINNNFVGDFTAFIYYDSNGAWPGYVLKKKADASALVAQDVFRKIETSKNLKGLFLKDPGETDGEFKNGEYKGIGTRYLAYSNDGAAVDYAWADNNLLVLTTYFPALKEVLDNKLIR